MTDQLDSLFTGDERRKSRARCVKCGGTAGIRVQVTVARVTQGGKPKQGENSTRSVRLCERHAVAVVDKIESVMGI